MARRSDIVRNLYLSLFASVTRVPNPNLRSSSLSVLSLVVYVLSFLCRYYTQHFLTRYHDPLVRNRSTPLLPEDFSKGTVLSTRLPLPLLNPLEGSVFVNK